MSKTTIQTKESLQDSLTKVIASPVEAFIQQKSASALEAEAAVAEIEKTIQKLGEDSPGTRALRGSIQELRYDPTADRRTRAQEAALAVVGACVALGVPVQIKQTAPGRAKSDGTGSRGGGGTTIRMSTAQIKQAGEKILGVMGKDFMTTTAIREKSELDEDIFRSALSRLKREELVKSNGERGRLGGLKKA